MATGDGSGEPARADTMENAEQQAALNVMETAVDAPFGSLLGDIGQHLHRFDPTFKDPESELSFRREFFNVWRRTIRNVFFVLQSIFVVVVLFYFAIVVPRDYTFVSAFFGDRVALGTELAYANMITPLLLIPVTAALYTRCYTERTFIWFVAIFSVGNFLAYGWAVHVREALDDTAWLSRPPPNCTEGHESFTDGVHESGASVIPDLVGRIVVRTTVHISLALVADVSVVIFTPSLLAVVVILALQHMTHLFKARYLWSFHYATDTTAVLVAYHLVSAILAVTAAYFRCRALREQWLVRHQLAAANEIRIERLAREKERLDYERAFAIKHAKESAAAGVGHSASNHHGWHDGQAGGGGGGGGFGGGRGEGGEGGGGGGGGGLEGGTSGAAASSSSAAAGGGGGGGGLVLGDGQVAVRIDGGGSDAGVSATTCSEIAVMTAEITARPHAELGYARECDRTPVDPSPRPASSVSKRDTVLKL